MPKKIKPRQLIPLPADEETPEWDLNKHFWIEDILTLKNRTSLINSLNGFWPKKFSDVEKNAFLDSANKGLNWWKHSKKATFQRATPAQQRKDLAAIADTVTKLKQQLKSLEGEAVQQADFAFMNAKYLTNPPFELLRKQEYGLHVGSLFFNTWIQLSDLEKVLISAANRIHVDVGYRPENYANDVIVNELALYWRRKKGKFPPRTKTGWFAKFVEELGETINLNLSIDMAERCIEAMEKVDKTIRDEAAEFKKTG
ncbi:hypothetical protein QN372_00940 [Undibacterium sp. RTI2.1]|uniref:hypothetical protein n=1 Tax=unclassified Undibacterium TaxID=2630295 RepID=UPI002B22A5A9|nr:MULTISPECIES: hypothetical protein [unclassified Undibacterium]MEB0029305.1 hypothetical protein [Undibacterium sp. RTI2.1]MEB0115613.1 hypothetical protein [Undibacterium sp. RTI2.2]